MVIKHKNREIKMTLSLYIDNEYQTEVGTTTGWGEFRRWAERLDVDKYEALIHLVLYSWSQQAEDIKSQLGNCIRSRYTIR